PNPVAKCEGETLRGRNGGKEQPSDQESDQGPDDSSKKRDLQQRHRNFLQGSYLWNKKRSDYGNHSPCHFSVGVFCIASTTTTSSGALRDTNFRPSLSKAAPRESPEALSRTRSACGGSETPALTADRICIALKSSGEMFSSRS